MGLIASPFAYYGPLAQLVEHLTFNQVVEGSIPSRLTFFIFAMCTEKSPSSSLAQDTALSRRRRGFESPWGRHFSVPKKDLKLVMSFIKGLIF